MESEKRKTKKAIVDVPDKGIFINKLPDKLNKFGEWLMSENRKGIVVINDMKAVLK